MPIKIPYFERRRAKLKKRRERNMALSDFVSTLKDNPILKKRLKLEPKGFERLNEIIKTDQLLNSSIDGLVKEIKTRSRPVIIDTYLSAIKIRNINIMMGINSAYARGMNGGVLFESAIHNNRAIDQLKTEFQRFIKHTEKEVEEKNKDVHFDNFTPTFKKASELHTAVAKKIDLKKWDYDFLTAEENAQRKKIDFELRKFQREIDDPKFKSR